VERAETIAKRVGYNYHALVWKISDEKFRRKIGIRIFPLFVIVVFGLFLVNFLVKIMN